MKKDYFLLHLSVFIAGFTGVLGRLITLDSAVLVWWRMAAAAVIMFLYLRFVETRRATSLQTETYRITNLMGQTVLMGSLNADTQRIDVSALPQGMYFITISDTTMKFVVR